MTFNIVLGWLSFMLACQFIGAVIAKVAGVPYGYGAIGGVVLWAVTLAWIVRYNRLQTPR
mgnify:FL=1